MWSLFFLLLLVGWGLNGWLLMIFVCDYYSNYTCLKSTSLVVGTAMLFGGIETLLILTLRVCFRYFLLFALWLIFSVFRYLIIRA